MLTKFIQIQNIEEIRSQVKGLQWDSKRIHLNETDGNLLSGKYSIKKEFLNTPLGDLLHYLGDIGEARLLKLDSGDTYTAHTDPDDRIHLVIETNPDCYIIDLDKKELHHLPVDGQLWMMDTSVTHVAANFGGQSRIHLNIRKRLPEFKAPGYHIKVTGGDFDWKQQLYSNIMSFLNNKIKSGEVTGIAKINERELLLNCDNITIEFMESNITNKGFQLEVTEVLP